MRSGAFEHDDELSREDESTQPVVGISKTPATHETIKGKGSFFKLQTGYRLST